MADHLKREIPHRRLIVLVLWMLFIWGHSCMPGKASSTESGFFLQLIRPLIEVLGIDDLTLVHTVLRKMAHFSEYAVLGILAWRALGSERFAAAVAIGIATPCIDETIQLFVPGRVGACVDVMIDMAGFALAFALCWLISRKR